MVLADLRRPPLTRRETMSRFREIALWLGLLAGVVAAVASLTEPPPDPLPEGSAAVVDGAVISRDRFLRTLASLAVRDRAPVLDEARRRQLLEELIAEELLLGRAVDLDLPRRDPLLRRRILSQLLADVSAEAVATPPTDEELRAFFRESGSLFATRKGYEVRSVWFRGNADEARRRALTAREALVEGGDFDAAAAAGDAPLVPLPDGVLSRAVLREYLGPTTARRVAELAPGEISEPIRVTGGYRVVQLVRSHDSPPPAFEDVKDTVGALLSRRRQAKAVERYVAELRDAASVRIDESLLAPDFAIPAAYLDRARRSSAEPGQR